MIDNKALARRAVVCSAWRWMPGMVAAGGGRIMEANGPKHRKTWHFLAAAWDGPELYVSEWENATTIPDLADPATLGCMLALVREAWGALGACVVGCTLDGWRFWLGDGYREHEERYPTEAEALVAALEAAPAREVAP